MRYAVIDTESTIYQKGHPYSDRNRLCLVGVRIHDVNRIYDIEYTDTPYADQLAELQAALDSVELLVGFNLKHDLAWLSRYGIVFRPYHRFWDCQLSEFILSHQKEPFPSLDKTAEKYGLGRKLDVVATEYWANGIDTPNVPKEILYPYLEQDLNLTDALYQRHLSHDSANSFTSLFNLHMQDLAVLQEMEFNGILIDWPKLEQRAKETEQELDEINRQVLDHVPASVRDLFNTRSNDHISLLLYGGEFKGRRGHQVVSEYKSGPRKGQSYIRTQWEDIHVEFAKLTEPIPGTELAKPGFWSTGADVLVKLKKPKKLIQLLLKQAELSKLLDTYFKGFPKIAEEMDWKDGYIHSKLNQCVVITGRLSSTKPNQQNMPEAMHEFIVSRY